jgi:hypothetical protein
VITLQIADPSSRPPQKDWKFHTAIYRQVASPKGCSKPRHTDWLTSNFGDDFWRSVGQSVLVSGTHLGPATNVFLLSLITLDSYGLSDVGRHQSDSESLYGWQSVSMSWCRDHFVDFWPYISSCSRVWVWNLLFCLCGAPFLTRGRVCPLLSLSLVICLNVHLLFTFLCLTHLPYALNITWLNSWRLKHMTVTSV